MVKMLVNIYQTIRGNIYHGHDLDMVREADLDGHNVDIVLGMMCTPS